MIINLKHFGSTYIRFVFVRYSAFYVFDLIDFIFEMFIITAWVVNPV